MNYISENDRKLASMLGLGISFDVVRKEIGTNIKGAVYFLSSLVDDLQLTMLNENIIDLDGNINIPAKISNGTVELESDINKVFVSVSTGVSVLISENEMYCIDTRSYPSRSINEPSTEQTIRGSRDGFNENIITNVGLIRRRIKSPFFRCPVISVGDETKTDVSLLYLENRADPDTVNDLLDKLSNTQTKDLVMSDRKLEEKLFKQNFNPFPLVRYSERPDLVAAHLIKGHVAIIVDTSASVITTPTTLFEHTKHVEEYRQAPSSGTLIRLIRYTAILLSIFLVPIWMITVENTDFSSFLLLKPTASSPLSLFAQILIVELTIELLRIATVHTPNHLSSAMGLIATLILGQMAVDIGVFQAEVLLYCSLSSIGGFATPSYELSLANKIVKLLLIVLVGLLGSTGFIIGFGFLIIFLSSIKIYKTPYFYPLIPFNLRELSRILFRPSIY